MLYLRNDRVEGNMWHREGQGKPIEIPTQVHAARMSNLVLARVHARAEVLRGFVEFANLILPAGRIVDCHETRRQEPELEAAHASAIKTQHKIIDRNAYKYNTNS